nr:S1C family serine protease [Neptuniibacter sp.]
MKLPNVIERVRPSVVLVEIYGNYSKLGTGSGVILDNGVILTARHVISKAARVVVVLDDGSRVASDELFTSCDMSSVDVGLIIVDPNISDSHASLSPNWRGTVGESVFAIGGPLGRHNTVAVGIISAHNRIRKDESFTQLDINGAPGSSGGPVFNRFGGVIGIVVRGSSYGMMYIVPADACEAVVGVYENVQRTQIK